MELISKLLPWLGAALSGPVGIATLAVSKLAPALGLTEATVETVKSTLDAFTPEKLAEKMEALKRLENEFKLECIKAGYQHEEQLVKLDLDQIAIVNKTIQVELENSDKETWYQKGWRPANGFAVAAGAFAGVGAVCILGYQAITTKDPAALNMIPALASAIAMILAIPGAAVGIAAWHRGMAQREEIKQEDAK